MSELKKLNKNYLSDEYFRDAFAATSLSEQRNLSQLEYDYSSAINEAYVSSLQNENAIRNSALGTGYKEALLKSNQDALMDAFNEYRNSYTSNLNETINYHDENRSAITDTYTAQEQYYMDQSERLANYFTAHYDYLKYLYENNPEVFDNYDFRNMFMNVDNEGNATLKSAQDLFNRRVEQTTDERGNTINVEKGFVDGDGNLTEYGQRYLDFLENHMIESVPTFSQYLYDENRELYDWASTYDSNYDESGYDLFRRITGRVGIDGEEPVNKYNIPNNYDYRIGAVADKLSEGNLVKLTKDNLIVGEDDEFVYNDDGDTVALMDGSGIETLESGYWRLSNNQEDIYTPESFVDNAESIDEGWRRNDVIYAAARAAQEGKLKNGTIIDVNKGKGRGILYMYWNGNFVKMVQDEPMNLTEVNKHDEPDDFFSGPSDGGYSKRHKAITKSDDFFSLLWNLIKDTFS